ncbi:MAG: hypothetical protein GWP15_04250, partial [Nitrospirae bacterium]|nr:hypothetical protein [Nitrospirota bacterium]
MSIIQIFLLVNFCVAQSYNINKTDKIFNLEINEVSKKLIKSSLNLLIGFLSIKQIGFVSAADTCCEKTNTGAYCQNVADASFCNSKFRIDPRNCESTPLCKKGYCVDVDGSSQIGYDAQCPDSWSLSEPAIGCCMLRENSQINTQAWCTKQDGEFDDSIISASKCKYYSPDKEGACVYETSDGLGTKTCTFESEKKCLERETGNPIFSSEDILCSRENLNTGCTRNENIGCYQGKIYWFDSCDNRENIYAGNSKDEKTASWYDGLVNRDVATFCVFSKDKDCGNCDSTNNICKVTKSGKGVAAGDFICADMGCIDETDNNKPRQNGESWCIYEGQVGENSSIGFNISTDIPGTSHFLKKCSHGEIKTDSCGDYRRSICGETENDDGVSEANCRPNLGVTCFEIEDMKKCESEPDCRIHKVDAADYFSFEACVPRYSIGFNPELYKEGGSHDADAVCGLATQTCTIVEQKQITSRMCGEGVFRHKCHGVNWVYIANEECDTNPNKFYKQMNDFCISLGDCGGYININGDYTGRNDVSSERYDGLNNTDGSYGDSGNPPMKLGGDASFEDIDKIKQNFANDRREDIEPGEIGGGTKNVKNALGLIVAVGMTAGAMTYGWGYVAAGIATIILVVIEIAFPNEGKILKTPLKFTCKPWEPPITEGNCKRCNEGELPCSKYFCESLGKCKILENEGGFET